MSNLKLEDFDNLSKQLIPCAHCGGTAFVSTCCDVDYFVICDECGMSTTGFKSPQEAIAAWNRRSQNENDNINACGWSALTKNSHPNIGEDVLVYSAGCREINKAYFSDGEWHYSLDNSILRQIITHWMPLFEPPCKSEGE